MSLKVFCAAIRPLFKRSKFHTVCICNKFRTYSTEVPSKIYELRVYTSQPNEFKKVELLFNEYIHLRLKYSKLFGFWSAEIGESIFQHVHIWEYDSLSHRRDARTRLLDDTAWQTEFMPQLRLRMQSMTNSLLAPAPGTAVNTNFKNDPSAVYELQSVDRSDKHPHALKNRDKEDILVGRFFGILGPTKTEYRLWRYQDIDKAFSESWHRTTAHSERGFSWLMHPLKFSPIS